MDHIRAAVPADANRLAEIEVFCYRLNFYPIFRNDAFYFDELTVPNLTQWYRDNPDALRSTWVYDDGVDKGFVRLCGSEIKKLFVEPVLQGSGIGTQLLTFAVETMGCKSLWALEKNVRALFFYRRHGFRLTGEKKYEEDTTEYLVRMERTQL